MKIWTVLLKWAITAVFLAQETTLISGEHYYTVDEFKVLYETNAIPFDSLEVTEVILQENEECFLVQDKVIKFRIPIQYENGDKENLTFTKMEKGGREEYQILDSKSDEVIETYVVDPYLNCKDHADPDLINHVKNEILESPSILPYNFPENMHKFGDGQPLLLDQKYFHESLKGGFFIEAGADDGEGGSTTLYFEQRHGWNGLLVEPLNVPYDKLKEKNRRAWSAMTCLSPVTRPKTVTFSKDFSSDVTVAGIIQEGNKNNNTIQMQCIPLYTLILSLGNPRVDFLSLDIEGAELDVLRTIPWDKVDIRALSVETQFIGEFYESTELIKSLLESKGFLHLDTISRDDIYVQMPRPDLVSVKGAKLPYHELHSPKQTAVQFLTKDRFSLMGTGRKKAYRICVLFNTPVSKLKTACKSRFPREYFRLRRLSEIPKCAIKTACPSDLLSLIGTLRISGYPWKTQLTDSCLNSLVFDSSDSS